MAKLNAIAKTRVAALMDEIGIDAAHKSAVVDFCAETKGEHDDEAFRLMAVDESWFPSDKKDEYLANTLPKAGEAKAKLAVSSEQVERVKDKAKPKAETTGEAAPKAETVPASDREVSRSHNQPLNDGEFQPVEVNVEVTRAKLYDLGREFLQIEQAISGGLILRVAELAATLLYYHLHPQGVDEKGEEVKATALPEFKDFRANVEDYMFKIEEIHEFEQRNAMIDRLKTQTISRNITTGVRAAYLMVGKPKGEGRIRTPKLGAYWFATRNVPPATDAEVKANPAKYERAIGAQWQAFEPEISISSSKSQPNNAAARITAVKERGETPTGLEDVVWMPDWAIAAQYSAIFEDKTLTKFGRVLKGTNAETEAATASNAKVVREMAPGEIINSGLPKVAAQLSSDEYKPTMPQFWLIFQAAVNACYGESGRILDDIVARYVEQKELTPDERAVHTTMCMLAEALRNMVGEAEASAEDIEAANKAMKAAA